MKHFLIWLWPVRKRGLYMTTSDDQLSGWTKKKLQNTYHSNLHQKTFMVTIRWSAAGQIHYSFLNPRKPLHPRSMLSKSMRCTKNFSWHWSTEKAQFSMTTPDHMLYNQRFTGWRNWATKFCLICHIHLTSHQLTTTSSSISITFCRENAFTTSRMHKKLSKSSSYPKAQIFMLQE